MDTEVLVRTRCDALIARTPPGSVPAGQFLGEQFDTGLAWVHFPVGCGGLGLSPALQVVVDRCLEDVGAPSAVDQNILGHGMAAPTIVVHGSEEQRQRLLRPLFTGAEIWCQLFSEPGAGSDLASLATRAVLDGDEWIVTGQKVWTTLGHEARWGLLLARTDPDVPKHHGLTYFVLDMRAHGVDVRALFQMTGEAEFNEVHLDGVRVPDSARVAGVGDGWRVAMTTLMNERFAIGGRTSDRDSGFIRRALDEWRRVDRNDAVARDGLARLWIEAEVLRLTNVRAASLRAAGTPGPEGSIGKIATAKLNQRIAGFVLGLLGPSGMLKPGGYPMRRPQRTELWGGPAQAVLRSAANSIEGGTTEIAKNVLAERVLGLPAEERSQREVPWRATTRA